jgi:hypothetical protein
VSVVLIDVAIRFNRAPDAVVVPFLDGFEQHFVGRHPIADQPPD